MNATDIFVKWSNDGLNPGHDCRFDAILDTWELARRSYAKVLLVGLDRSDAQLARDSDYRNLLAAGIRLRNLCGPGAIFSASIRLAACVSNGSSEHFERLWAGLLPAEKR